MKDTRGLAEGKGGVEIYLHFFLNIFRNPLSAAGPKGEKREL
jgi:hypothetical protein